MENREITVAASLENTPWLTTLLTELTNSITGGGDEKLLDQDYLNLNMVITKRISTKWKEYLTIDLSFDGIFNPPCIRCLQRSNAQLEGRFKACVIAEELESHDELQDTSDIFVNNEERELFFYQGQKVQIYPVIWELVALNIDPNPLHSEDCKGLCYTCGINLNEESCSHTS